MAEFEYLGEKLKAIDTIIDGSCCGCLFQEDTTGCACQPGCVPLKRTDSRSIIWVKDDNGD